MVTWPTMPNVAGAPGWPERSFGKDGTEPGSAASNLHNDEKRDSRGRSADRRCVGGSCGGARLRGSRAPPQLDPRRRPPGTQAGRCRRPRTKGSGQWRGWFPTKPSGSTARRSREKRPTSWGIWAPYFGRPWVLTTWASIVRRGSRFTPSFHGQSLILLSVSRERPTNSTLCRRTVGRPLSHFRTATSCQDSLSLNRSFGEPQAENSYGGGRIACLRGGVWLRRIVCTNGSPLARFAHGLE